MAPFGPERRARRLIEEARWTEYIQLLKKHGAPLANATFSPHGKTALHTAAFHGKMAAAVALLDAGANVDAKSTLGYTPLHAAVRGGRAIVADLLIRRGADVDARDTQMSTPLHVAAWRNTSNVVKVLLTAGANPCLRDVRGDRPIDVVRNASTCRELKEMLVKAVRNSNEDDDEIYEDMGSSDGKTSASSGADDIRSSFTASEMGYIM